MIVVTSVDAQNRFGELIDRAQREPVEITRRGHPVAYVISEHELKAFQALSKRREAAASWYTTYRQRSTTAAAAAALTDQDVNQLVHELR